MSTEPISLVPGILDQPEVLAMAEKAILELLESSNDNTRLKAAEMIIGKHQLGGPDSKKAIATKEEIEHLRSIIGEVKEVLEGHVSFYERKLAGSTTPRPS